DVLATEYQYRFRSDREISLEEYIQRFPDLEARIRERFPLLLTSEQIQTLNWSPYRPGPSSGTQQDEHRPVTRSSARIRCPHCHNPLELADERPDEVLCPVCGCSFHVRDTRLTTTASGTRRIGKFQLLERVALGAVGAVWRARDTELDRLVALKIPHAS